MSPSGSGQITHIKPTIADAGAGHFNVLLGETGSGKTSLIKLMAGLDPLRLGPDPHGRAGCHAV